MLTIITLHAVIHSLFSHFYRASRLELLIVSNYSCCCREYHLCKIYFQVVALSNWTSRYFFSVSSQPLPSPLLSVLLSQNNKSLLFSNLFSASASFPAFSGSDGFIQHNFLVPGLELLFESNDSHTWRKNHLCENIFKWLHCPSCTSPFFFSVSSQPLHCFLGLSFFSKPLRGTYLPLCSPPVPQVVVVLYNSDI